MHTFGMFCRRNVWTVGIVLLPLICAMQVASAHATCALPDRDRENLAKFGEEIRVLLDGAVIQVIQADASNSAAELASLPQSFDQQSPILPNQIEVKEGGALESIASPNASSDAKSALVILDSEFMSASQPKYNSILSAYRDVEISPDIVMIVDGFLVNAADQPMIIQINATLDNQATAYMLEAALILGSGLPSPPNQLWQYASSLTDDADDGTIDSSANMRTEILACLFPLPPG